MMAIPPCEVFKHKGHTYSLTPLIPKEVRRDQMVIRDKRKKEKTHSSSTRKEDKESLIVSYYTR